MIQIERKIPHVILLAGTFEKLLVRRLREEKRVRKPPRRINSLRNPIRLTKAFVRRLSGGYRGRKAARRICWMFPTLLV